MLSNDLTRTTIDTVKLLSWPTSKAMPKLHTHSKLHALAVQLEKHYQLSPRENPVTIILLTK